MTLITFPRPLHSHLHFAAASPLPTHLCTPSRVVAPSQARDFAATLRARDPGVWERLRNYQAMVYFILTGKSTGKMRDYPDALLIWHLQVAWMEHTRHPALAVLAEDPALANEELGEISLSEFSKGVKAGSCSPDAASMSKEYRMQGASRDVVHDYQENLELPQEDNYHEVTSDINTVEVARALQTLKALRKGLHTDVQKAYECFDIECSVSSTGKKTGKKVPATATPVMKKTLVPFFVQPDVGEEWDVDQDFQTIRTRYFNTPPTQALVRDSESDSEDSDPLPAVRRVVAPVYTRAMTATTALQAASP